MIDISDSTELSKVASGYINVTDAIFETAVDLDGSGDIDISDYTAHTRAVSGVSTIDQSM